MANKHLSKKSFCDMKFVIDPTSFTQEKNWILYTSGENGPKDNEFVRKRMNLKLSEFNMETLNKLKPGAKLKVQESEIMHLFDEYTYPIIRQIVKKRIRLKNRKNLTENETEFCRKAIAEEKNRVFFSSRIRNSNAFAGHGFDNDCFKFCHSVNFKNTQKIEINEITPKKDNFSIVQKESINLRNCNEILNLSMFPKKQSEIYILADTMRKSYLLTAENSKPIEIARTFDCDDEYIVSSDFVDAETSRLKVVHLDSEGTVRVFDTSSEKTAAIKTPSNGTILNGVVRSFRGERNSLIINLGDSSLYRMDLRSSRPELLTDFSIGGNKICSLKQSLLRPNMTLLSTEKHLYGYDNRFWKKWLFEVPHLMKSPACFIAEARFDSTEGQMDYVFNTGPGVGVETLSLRLSASMEPANPLTNSFMPQKLRRTMDRSMSFKRAPCVRYSLTGFGTHVTKGNKLLIFEKTDFDDLCVTRYGIESNSGANPPRTSLCLRQPKVLREKKFKKAKIYSVEGIDCVKTTSMKGFADFIKDGWKKNSKWTKIFSFDLLTDFKSEKDFENFFLTPKTLAEIILCFKNNKILSQNLSNKRICEVLHLMCKEDSFLELDYFLFPLIPMRQTAIECHDDLCECLKSDDLRGDSLPCENPICELLYTKMFYKKNAPWNKKPLSHNFNLEINGKNTDLNVGEILFSGGTLSQEESTPKDERKGTKFLKQMAIQWENND